MKGQFIAIYQSNSTTQVTTHSNLFAAQRALLRFVKSKKCTDIPKIQKAGIKTYADLLHLVFQTAVQGGWDAFVVSRKAVQKEGAL